jgi:hypothetical protein
MKTDTYTKVVLTSIAIFLGFIAFDYKPTINAHAASGGVEMISAGAKGEVWHLRDGRIRRCSTETDRGVGSGSNYCFNAWAN